MKNRSILNIFFLLALLPLVSCNAADRSEARVEIGDEKVSVAGCSEAVAGMHQLVYAFG